MFDPVICDLLQNPPRPDEWDGPWSVILTTLFSASQSYFLAPKKRRLIGGSHLVMEVQKFPTTLTLPLRTVLVIEIRDAPYWPASIPAQEAQIKRHIDAAFAGTEVSRARSKVYWISAIGPHWRYGFKDDDGQDLAPLIEWHHTVHDQDSYQDLQDLVNLLAPL